MPFVLPPAPPVTSGESHILDGLDVADGTLFEIADTPVFTPAPLRMEWVGSVDGDGTIPADQGHSDNATLMLPLRVKKQATADLAWHKLGLIVGKLEAARRSSTGLPHLWTPKDATDTWELTVRAGDITEFPMNDRDSLLGYLRRFPRITITLHCDPFLYRQGESVTYGPTTSALPVFSLSLANVPGHVEAEATVTVTDAASQARQHVEGGIGEDSAAALLIDSAALTALGGTATTRTGAYSSDGVIRATLGTQAQAVCGTGNLTHVGVHRPKARVWASSTDVRVRLAYRTGDGTYSYTPWVTPPLASDFSEVAFGTVTIRRLASGQRWDGRIEAYALVAGATLDVDTFMMLPADRYWGLSTPYRYQAGVLTARDEFAGTVGDLGGEVAPLGGSWVTSGAATDFAASSGRVMRATVSEAGPRYAILGATNYTDQEVGVTVEVTAGLPDPWLIARYVNATNFLAAELRYGNPAWRVFAYVGGSTEVLDEIPLTAAYTTRKMRVVVFASGRLTATLLDPAGATIAEIQAYHTSLATGGAIASGKPGFADQNGFSAPSTRYYDDFYPATPPAEQFVIHSGRTVEIRHDSAERQSSDGTTWATLQPRGGRVLIPCAGDEGRVTRLWTKARRQDIDTLADTGITDSTTVSVVVRPRYRMPTNP
jgi:hypothetical protein